MGDDVARVHGDVGIELLEQGFVETFVLADDDEQIGVDLARGHDDRQVVDVVVGAGDDADRALNTGLIEGLGIGAADA